MGVVLRLTNEALHYMEHPLGDEGFEQDEIVFDQLYAYAHNIFDLPLDISVGRQDFAFQYGEGFLIMDGTPCVGDKTSYFNAAKVVIKFTKNNSLDLIYITNPEKDHYLPSVYAGEKRQLNQSDEQGFVVYSKNKINNHVNFDAYYILKLEEKPALAHLRGSAPPFISTEEDLELHTFGVRAVYTFGGYTLRGEFAHQVGEYDSGIDRSADGGYVFIARQHNELMWEPAWELGFVYLTGDDPNTPDKDEGFNPLFARWSWLSEMFLFTMAPERTPAYWTNMELYRFGLGLTFNDTTALNLKYNYMRAPEDANNIFSVAGEKERGHLIMGKLSHQFSKKVSGYLTVEHLINGDHYAYDDRATFLRWHLKINF